MFEIICTGKNLNYGKDQHKRLLNDSNLMYALKNDIIYPDSVKYVGSQGNKSRTGTVESLMPLKKVNLIMTLESQNNHLQRLIKVCNNILQANKKYLKMYKEEKK